MIDNELELGDPIHNSRPPLRWIANAAGSLASKNILKLSYMEDDGNTGLRYKYYGFLWDTFWPIYQKYGTFYEFKPELYSEWDYEDEETGDAMRIIYNEE